MSSDELTQFRTMLAASGYHITKARENTFKLLLHPEPQSMGELLAKSKRGGTAAVDRVSVYRSLELFEKLGIVHRIYVGWKYKLELSDQFVSHHHHLSCLRCGKIIDIEDERHINQFIQQVADSFGFQPRRHQFEIDGYCHDCLQATQA